MKDVWVLCYVVGKPGETPTATYTPFVAFESPDEASEAIRCVYEEGGVIGIEAMSLPLMTIEEFKRMTSINLCCWIY